jgi:hypothetical protein
MNGLQSELVGADYRLRRSLTPLYVCALTATAFVLPMCLLGNPSGHDLQPHLASWMDIQAQWHQGIWFPRWAEWSNFGFGEPRFIFYPPLTPLLGAAFGSVLPWRIVPGLMVWIGLFVAGIGVFKFASDWLNPRQALIASILFAANPYNIVLVYYRSAFAELIAAALFPLLIWAVLGIVRHEWGRAPALAAVFAAIWLSNTPAGVIATYTVVIVLALCCVRRKDARPLLPAAASLAIGLGLSAFYLVPAWREQRWIDVAAIISGDGNPERNFLFSVNNLRGFLGFNWLVSAVAVYLMLMTAIAIVCEWRQRRARADFFWTMTMLAIVSSLLMFPVSKLLWRYLPTLAFLQFPWRWLIVLSMCWAALVAAAIASRPKLFWVVVPLVCAAALVLSLKVGWGGHDVSVVAQKFASGAGYFSTTNFTPAGANRFTLDENAPRLQRVDEKGELIALKDVTVQISEWSAQRKHFSVQAKEEITLAVKLLNYPAWEVSIDGRPTTVESLKNNGQILINLPEGEYGIDLRFRRTRDRTIGGLISAGSVILFLIVGGILWRRERRRFRAAALA